MSRFLLISTVQYRDHIGFLSHTMMQTLHDNYDYSYMDIKKIMLHTKIN